MLTMKNRDEDQLLAAANSNRPWLVYFAYATASHEQGDVLSRHSTHELAQRASKRSGYDSFLGIRNANDYR